MLKYEIYQMNIKDNRKFQGLDSYEFLKLGDTTRFDLKDFKKVYEGEIEGVENVHRTLEQLYTMFNINHPQDFRGHSLSVSDMVVIDNQGFYCDSWGWKEVEVYGM